MGDLFPADAWGLGDLGRNFGAALNIGADASYDQPRTAQTQTTNAIGSMQPIQDTGSGWSGFWQGALQTAVGYAIAKDAHKSGLTSSSRDSGAPVYAAAPQAGMVGGLGGFMPLLIVGAIVFVAVKALD